MTTCNNGVHKSKSCEELSFNYTIVTEKQPKLRDSVNYKTAASKDRDFKNHAQTQEEEDAFDYVAERSGINPTSLVGAIAHLIKGALGGGILGGPVAYKKAGVAISIPVHILVGIYMGFNLYNISSFSPVLILCGAKIIANECWRIKLLCLLLWRYTGMLIVYFCFVCADCGEAALMLFPMEKVAKFAKCFRYLIDAIICVDLFGSCCVYQIIVATSLKQLVENTHETSMDGAPGYPNLRIYLLILIPLFILICLITHLKYLVPFSLGANVVVMSAILMVVYYCFEYNPTFSDLTLITDFDGLLQFVGLSVFSMSCAGVVIPIEGNMKEPKKFTVALTIGQGSIIFCTVCTSFFGYAAFKEAAEAPFTINFPMTTIPMIFKAGICVMIYITHALNFWVPFNLCWYYIAKRVNQDRLLMWERIFRTIFVLTIGIIAVVFPSIAGLMGFIGCFCLSNMAIIWPNFIFALVMYVRPGYGRFRWRLWRSIIFGLIGFFILICGSIVNVQEMITTLGF